MTPHRCPHCTCHPHDTDHPGRWNRDAPYAHVVATIVALTTPTRERTNQ